MLTNKHVLAAIISAFVFGPLATAATQQTPDASSSSAPPPISFGKNDKSANNFPSEDASLRLSDLPTGEQSVIAEWNRQTESQSGNQNRSLATGIVDASQPDNQIRPLSTGFADERQSDSQDRSLSTGFGGEGSVRERLGPPITADSNRPADPAVSNIYMDSQTRPAAHFGSDPFPESESIARQILQTFDVSQSKVALPGQPVSLTDVMRTTAIESRPEMIRAYWQAFEKWTANVGAQTEANQLADLQQPSSAIERDLLSTALSLAKSRILESEIDLGSAQQSLRQFAATIGPDILPLASDLPLVDEYETNYATLAARAPFNSRLNQINETLPKYFQIIQARADASAKCGAASRQAIQACNQNQLALGSALEAIRMHRDSQQDFARAVTRYNLDIAEYALTVAPFGQPPDQVVSMLIKRSEGQPINSTSVARSTTLDTQQQAVQSSNSQADRSNTLRGSLTQSSQDLGEATRLESRPNSILQSNSDSRPIPQSRPEALRPAIPKTANATPPSFGNSQDSTQAPSNPLLQSQRPPQNTDGSFPLDKR